MMGQQVSSLPQKILPNDTVDSLQFEIKKQAQIFSEIGSLSYEDFQKCLADLNNLSRKCLDPNGKQLVFAVKKGTDSSVLWKGTVRIACVKVDPITKKVECYKLLNLKQFLQVFRTFQTNLHAMVTVETQRIRSPTSSPTHSTPPHSSPLLFFIFFAGFHFDFIWKGDDWFEVWPRIVLSRHIGGILLVVVFFRFRSAGV